MSKLQRKIQNLKTTYYPILTSNLQEGFTLIELLVVIGILAILLSIVLIAINPARQFAQANNIRRRSDVSALLNGIHQYAADNNGTLPPGMPSAGSSEAISSTTTGYNFCASLVPTYLAELPKDPSVGSSYVDCNSYETKYDVFIASASAGNTPRITVSAPEAELAVGISVTR